MTGSITHELLHEILDQFRSMSGLPNTNQTACRCGDSSYDFLRKILHVSRLDAGLPDLPTYEFRPGDSDFNLTFKSLIVLTSDDCRCGDSIFNLWRRILESLRLGCDLPNAAEFSFRPGDSINDLLRKILSVLNNCDVEPPVIVGCCLLLESNGFDLLLESIDECLELESCP